MSKLFHINHKGQINECHAKNGKCPYSASEHFDSIEKAQEYMERMIHRASKQNTSVELTKHNYSDDIFRAKNADRNLPFYRGELNRIIKKDFEKWYKNKVQDMQAKHMGQIPSKEKMFEEFKQTSGAYRKAESRALQLESNINTLLSQRVQAIDFANKFDEDIVDYSFSNASCSAYFVVNKTRLTDVREYLENKGFHIDERRFLEFTKGDNFLIRFSDHYPKAYLKRNEENGELFGYTNASMCIMYRDEELPGKATKNLQRFLDTCRW